MDIIDKKYFPKYYELIGKEIPELVNNFDFSEQNGDLGYRTQASAVYSSNIEGNSIDLNTFMNYKLSQEKFKSTKEIEEIENLVSAYEYAQQNELDEDNLLECHRILSETLLIKSKRGKYRSEKVGVFGQTGIVYLAIEPENVQKAMKVFFEHLKVLINDHYTVAETFYFASILHMKLAHIHPFRDGNGRITRLVEKWFLAEELGRDFWKIPSEKYYKDNQVAYYSNISMGANYYELNYNKCLPFLTTLPNSLGQ